MTAALFVGRFQPFHDGHLKAICEMLRKHGKVIIIIGSSRDRGTGENPFSVEERIEMARLALEARGISKFVISSIEDLHDDRLWAEAIMKAYRFDIVYSRNPWVLRCFRKMGMKASMHRPYSEARYSGRHIRSLMAAGKDWEALVPAEVAGYIRSIGGVERVRKLLAEPRARRAL